MIHWLRCISRSPSRTFTFTALAFCGGILIGPLFLFASDAVPWFFFAALLGAILWKPSATRFVLIVCTALFVGMLRIQQTNSGAAAEFQEVMGKEVRVGGTVRGEVGERISGVQFEMDHLVVRDQPLEGAILVRASGGAHLTDGAEVKFVCRLEAPEPIETFRYDRYLSSRGIFAICSRPEHLDVRVASRTTLGTLLAFKSAIVKRLGQLFPEPHASFLSGLLFGGSSALSPELRDDFARTGTAHILAASGFNVSLITIVLLRILLQSRLGRRRTLIITTILLVLYTLIAGATASVVRAALMAGVLLVGLGVRRRADSLNLLLLAAAILLFWNPHQLLDDVGFQLSFAATAAILFAVPRIKNWFRFVPDRFGIRESFVGSVAASFVTAPIILWHFGSFSLISPLANLFVLPFIPYVMAGAFAVLMVSLVSELLAVWIGTLVWLATSIQLFFLQTFSALPIAFLVSEQARLAAFFSALIVFFVLLWLSKRPAAGHVI